MADNIHSHLNIKEKHIKTFLFNVNQGSYYLDWKEIRPFVLEFIRDIGHLHSDYIYKILNKYENKNYTLEDLDLWYVKAYLGAEKVKELKASFTRLKNWDPNIVEEVKARDIPLLTKVDYYYLIAKYGHLFYIQYDKTKFYKYTQNEKTNKYKIHYQLEPGVSQGHWFNIFMITGVCADGLYVKKVGAYNVNKTETTKDDLTYERHEFYTFKRFAADFQKTLNALNTVAEGQTKSILEMLHGSFLKKIKNFVPDFPIPQKINDMPVFYRLKSQESKNHSRLRPMQYADLDKDKYSSFLNHDSYLKKSYNELTSTKININKKKDEIMEMLKFPNKKNQKTNYKNYLFNEITYYNGAIYSYLMHINKKLTCKNVKKLTVNIIEEKKEKCDTGIETVKLLNIDTNQKPIKTDKKTLFAILEHWDSDFYYKLRKAHALLPLYHFSNKQIKKYYEEANIALGQFTLAAERVREEDKKIAQKMKDFEAYIRSYKHIDSKGKLTKEYKLEKKKYIENINAYFKVMGTKGNGNFKYPERVFNKTKVKDNTLFTKAMLVLSAYTLSLDTKLVNYVIENHLTQGIKEYSIDTLRKRRKEYLELKKANQITRIAKKQAKFRKKPTKEKQIYLEVLSNNMKAKRKALMNSFINFAKSYKGKRKNINTAAIQLNRSIKKYQSEIKTMIKKTIRTAGEKHNAHIEYSDVKKLINIQEKKSKNHIIMCLQQYYYSLAKLNWNNLSNINDYLSHYLEQYAITGRKSKKINYLDHLKLASKELYCRNLMTETELTREVSVHLTR